MRAENRRQMSSTLCPTGKKKRGFGGSVFGVEREGNVSVVTARTQVTYDITS